MCNNQLGTFILIYTSVFCDMIQNELDTKCIQMPVLLASLLDGTKIKKKKKDNKTVLDYAIQLCALASNSQQN